MKEYILENYRHFVDLHTDMCNELNLEFQDLEFTSNNFTDCEILEIVKPTDFNDRPDFIVEVSVKGGIKQFCMRPAVEQKVIILDEEHLNLFNEFISKLDAAYAKWQEVMAEQTRISAIETAKAREAYEARKAAFLAKKAEKEAQEKFEKKIAKAQQDFELKIGAYIKIEQDPIDWLKENVVSVTATIPTHLEKIFVKQFGDAPHKTVDSSRKTSGGYSMKFGPSFCLTVKKDVPVHPAIAHLFKENRLHDTSFIAKLVRDGELSFGKSE